MKCSIHIGTEPLFSEGISPLIYGEFVEYIYGMIPGMWSERIRDRSFTGFLQPTMYYRKEVDFPEPAWQFFTCGDKLRRYYFPVDAVYDLDPVNAFNGEQSARIRVGGRGEFLAGIKQTGISVKAGERLNVEMYMRGDMAVEEVQVIIGREYGVYADRYASCTFKNITQEWQRYEAVVTVEGTDRAASFMIALDKPGTIWVDKVSLMPEESRDGWRPEIVEAVKAVKPGIIRFGGSSLIWFDWRTCIGPREKRVPFMNRYWGTVEELDVGLDEFLRFCELVEAEPLICVNSNTSTPEDIARQVEYVNGAATTEMGRLRTENGHTAPYGVKYWQVGNEQAGPAYEAVLEEYIAAMKAKDPSILLLAASGSDSLVTGFGGKVDYICPHFYSHEIEDAVRETQQLRESIDREAGARGMKLGITEWNSTAADWGEPRARLQTLANGLFCARMFNHFQRNGDLIRIANRSNLVNSCYSGSIQTSGDDIYCTPAYYVQKVYSTLSGNVALRADSDDPALDLSATASADGRSCIVWIVNPEGAARECEIEIEGCGQPEAVRVITLTGPSPDAVNSIGRPRHIAPVEEALQAGEAVKVMLPPWSLTGVEMEFKIF